MAAQKRQEKSRVLVIGGGIAGVTVAERLSRAGVEVHLVEKQADIGGHAREFGCKATDICMRCNVCVADEMLRAVRQIPSVRIHTATQLADLKPGTNGSRFAVSLVPAAAARSGGPARKRGGKDATALDVSAVVVAIGYEPFRPSENAAYGYGRVPNVITGLEAEQQLAAKYRIVRPSDGQPPRRIAFVMCVGSRTEEVFRGPESADYCSTVCCAYSLRMAQRIKYQTGDAHVTLFYMDIQNFGKGFDRFYRECQDRMRFVRSRPHEIRPGTGGSVRVKYAAEVNGAAVCEEEFDLVILSVGIRPPADARSLAETLGVAVDENGFFGLKGAAALSDLQREGIYVAGASESPKDIAGSMASAEAVSTAILTRLHLARARADGKKVRREVAVIGSGVAGLQAALSLAELGHAVILFHREENMGGRAGAFPELFGHVRPDLRESVDDVQRTVDRLARAAKGNRNIRLYPRTVLKRIKGEPGDFSVVAATVGGNDEEFKVGAVVLSTGFPCVPAFEASGVDKTHRTVGMRGLVEMIRAGTIPKRVAIVMDIAAEQGRAVSGEVLAAAELMTTKFGARVKIYCNHVRVAAPGLEARYRRAREAGVMIVKQAGKPAIFQESPKIVVTAVDAAAGVQVSDEFDLLVMADLHPSDDTKDTVNLIQRLSPGPERVLQYDSVWLLPVYTNRPGMFAAGAARGNSEYTEALTDGLAVAGEVHSLLCGPEIEAREDAATVDTDKCVLCLTCLRVCPHGAIGVDTAKNAARVSAVSCKRCGICAAECPVKAITLPGSTDEEIDAAIGGTPRVTVFACERSATAAADAAGDGGRGAGIQLVKVPCAGRVDPRTILGALEKGAEKVLIIGCHPESCRYLTGSCRAAKRARHLASVLNKAGFDGSKVVFGGISSVEPGRYVEYLAAKQREERRDSQDH